MKVKEIIELIDFISKKKLEEVKIETAEIKLSVKKTGGSRIVEQQVYASAPVVTSAPVMQSTPAQPQTTAPASGGEKPTNSANNNYVTIKSPMIGTFYRSADPESPSFVNIGDSITSGQTICIIEAMKLFNEIEADVSGKIVEVLVENATPVEFDQPLFVVDPS